jgi:hypothetical protein
MRNGRRARVSVGGQCPPYDWGCGVGWLRAIGLALVCWANAVWAADANRLVELDGETSSTGRTVRPRLTTPQWVGEEGVDCVVLLGLEAEGTLAEWQPVVRPVVERLKQIEGRAPLSLFARDVDPGEPPLRTWLLDGVRVELLLPAISDLNGTGGAGAGVPSVREPSVARWKAEYDERIDRLTARLGTAPVVCRIAPGNDAANVGPPIPGPHFLGELFPLPTPGKNFLRGVVADSVSEAEPGSGSSVEPFPWVAQRICWVFPAVPAGAGGKSPKVLSDWKRAVDHSVQRQGVCPLVVRLEKGDSSAELIEWIDYAVATYGTRVRFLTIREALERLETQLLDGQPLRAANGQDNGVRLLELNADGFLDVVIGSEKFGRTKVWQPSATGRAGTWSVFEFPTRFLQVDRHGRHYDAQVRFGVVQENGWPTVAVSTSSTRRAWDFAGDRWVPNVPLRLLFRDEPERVSTGELGVDLGLRFRDLDGDGVSEIVVGNSRTQAVYRYDRLAMTWRDTGWVPPETLRITEQGGRDGGTRFVDLNGDRRLDLVVSNEKGCGVWLLESPVNGWGPPVFALPRSDAAADVRLPAIAVDGSAEGCAIEGESLVWRNELLREPVRRTFRELLVK